MPYDKGLVSKIAGALDHMYADVVSARAAGMLPVLIDRHGTSAQAVDLGVARIETLDRLEEALP